MIRHTHLTLSLVVALMVMGCATTRRSVYVESLRLEGVTGSFTISRPSEGPIDPNDITIGQAGSPLGARGVGGFTPIQGNARLVWVRPTGEEYVLNGQAYWGIRRDSPRYFDFALIVDSAEDLAAVVLQQIARLKTLNADSVFLSARFEQRNRVLWLCKFENPEVGPMGFAIDW